MEIDVNFSPSIGGTEALTASLMKFETMRSKVGVGATGALTVVGLLALPVPMTVVFGLGLVLMLGLALTWMRTAKLAMASALAVTGPVRVQMSSHEIRSIHGGEAKEFVWDRILHVTEAAAGWIFVVKKSRSAIVVPRDALSSAQVDELTTFLASWPRRRNRHIVGYLPVNVSL